MVKGLEVEQLSANREGESSWPKLVEGEAGSQGTMKPRSLYTLLHTPYRPTVLLRGEK